jgi:hypothetical protein
MFGLTVSKLLGISKEPGHYSGKRPDVRDKTIDDFFRELSEPWHSYVGKIEGLTPELERDFRNGTTIEEMNDQLAERIGKYVKFDFRTGAGLTFDMHSKVPESEFKIYQAWATKESAPKDEDPNAKKDLVNFLSKYKIKLWCEEGIKDSHYRITKEILSVLPEHHLKSRHFNMLEFGGVSATSATCSEYHDKSVRMFPYALEGPVRNFVGLLLHESGHAFYHSLEGCLSSEEMTKVDQAYRTIRRNSATLNVDYLKGPESRNDSLCQLDEFIAENYMIYVTQGERLRQHIASIKDKKVQDAWVNVYRTIRKGFCGIEYTCGVPNKKL